MKALKLLTGIFMIVVLGGGINGFADEIKPIIDIGESPCYKHVTVTTIGTAIGQIWCGSDYESYCKRETSFVLQGSGFVIGEYVITAAHVIHPDSVTTPTDGGGGLCTTPFKILNTMILVDDGLDLEDVLDGGTPATVYYKDLESDFAILKLAHTAAVESMPFDLEYTYVSGRFGNRHNILFIGTPIAAIVRERDENGEKKWAVEIREGKIISSHVAGDIAIESLQTFGSLDFTTDIDVFPGDSGSPVVSISRDKPVIIGILRAGKTIGLFGGMFPGISYVARIDGVKKILELK